MDTLVVASVIAIPVLVMLIIGLFIRTGNKKKHKKGEKGNEEDTKNIDYMFDDHDMPKPACICFQSQERVIDDHLSMCRN